MACGEGQVPVLVVARVNGQGRDGMSGYVRRNDPGGSGEWIEHLGGVEWFYAPVPKRWHRCWPQTRAWSGGELVERCACGSLRFDGRRPWTGRNSSSRKPLTPEQQAEQDRGRAADELIRQYHEAEHDRDTARMAEIREALLRTIEPGRERT